MSKTSYYISTGRKNGYYTLRTQWNEGEVEHDNFVMVLNRDPEKSIKKARDYLAASSICYTLDESITCELSDIERSKDWSIFRSGKHEGKSIEWVVENDFDYAVWASQNLFSNIYKKTINLLREIPVIKKLIDEKVVVDAQKKIDEENKQKAEAARKHSLKHIGSIGERITLFLKVVGRANGKAIYGNWNLTIMETEEGNKCIWWNYLNVEKDDFVEVKAVVKEHTYRDKEPQTVLNRVKLV